jgi:hypothetical protein
MASNIHNVFFIFSFAKETDDEETLSVIEFDVHDSPDSTNVVQEDMDISYSEDIGMIYTQQKPESFEERTQRLKQKLKTAFNSLHESGNNNSMLAEHFMQDRVIVDVSTVLEIFNNSCQHSSCQGTSRVVKTDMDAGVLKVSWECSEGHFGFLTSSRKLCEKNGQNIYVNTLLLAAAVLISGNNFDKMELFSKFLGLSFISKATYNRIQTHYVIPEVKIYWEEMKNKIWDVLAGESTILCGDGRNDSPGHSAKYCMYALMEQHLEVIVDVEVVDKRETGGVSTNMEVFGLKKIMERIVGQIMVSEIVTDASAAVIALVRKMKGTGTVKYRASN